MNNWSAFDHGHSIGMLSIEGGTVLYDEEHESGARITLRRSNSYTSISLNIYGWMDHTRFFTIDTDAQREYRAMRSAVDELMEVINTDGVRDIKIWEAISDFVRRFP